MKSTDLDGILQKEQTREFVEQTAAFHPVEGDLLEEQKLCDAVKEITKTADIEVLVNAAGVGHYGLHEELTPKKIQAWYPYKPRDSPASDEPAASGAEEKSWIYHQYLVRDGQSRAVRMAVPMRQPKRDCPASERVCLRKHASTVSR